MSNFLAPKVNPQPIIVNWPGSNGTQHATHRYDIGAVFYEVGGVYIFCKQTVPGSFQAIYVGESDNLWSRLTENLTVHHRWECAVSRGITHICAVRIDDAAERLRIETDLRHSLNPPCNRQ
jgi:hypothetical protein